jgi:hypothetical protein
MAVLLALALMSGFHVAPRHVRRGPNNVNTAAHTVLLVVLLVLTLLSREQPGSVASDDRVVGGVGGLAVLVGTLGGVGLESGARLVRWARAEFRCCALCCDTTSRLPRLLRSSDGGGRRAAASRATTKLKGTSATGGDGGGGGGKRGGNGGDVEIGSGSGDAETDPRKAFFQQRWKDGEDELPVDEDEDEEERDAAAASAAAAAARRDAAYADDDDDDDDVARSSGVLKKSGDDFGRAPNERRRTSTHDRNDVHDDDDTNDDDRRGNHRHYQQRAGQQAAALLASSFRRRHPGPWCRDPDRLAAGLAVAVETTVVVLFLVFGVCFTVLRAHQSEYSSSSSDDSSPADSAPAGVWGVWVLAAMLLDAVRSLRRFGRMQPLARHAVRLTRFVRSRARRRCGRGGAITHTSERDPTELEDDDAAERRKKRGCCRGGGCVKGGGRHARSDSRDERAAPLLGQDGAGMEQEFTRVSEQPPAVTRNFSRHNDL